MFKLDIILNNTITTSAYLISDKLPGHSNFQVTLVLNFTGFRLW